MPFIIDLSFYIALILSFYELIGIFFAFIKNKTKSKNRVFLRLSVFILIVLLFWQYKIWTNYIRILVPPSETTILPPEIKLENTPFLICVFTIAILLSFLVIEITNLISARKQGITKNISRLYSSIIILICLLPIFKGTLSMWDDYTNKLEGRYKETKIQAQAIEKQETSTQPEKNEIIPEKK